jgi:LuxR family maltose regulon positive regulatory protein
MLSFGRPYELILQTKLCRPRLAVTLVERERLFEQLDRASRMPLTLVSAPAGYGKSILLSQWVERSIESPAWLALDESDSDLRAFLRYFIAAIRSRHPAACPASGELLQAAQLPPVAFIASQLLNEIATLGNPCLVVLDDYHRIDRSSPVQALMMHLLEHPASELRLLILCRQDPAFALARLRAAGDLVEIRQRDLRFAPSETLSFVRGAVSDMPMSEAALERLDGEVEGWAVGLQLIAMVLSRVADTEAFLLNLGGGVADIQDYLLQEVVDQQEPELRERMLQSAVLNRFCAELVDALQDPSAPEAVRNAHDFIDTLCQRNLFTVSIDNGGRWYRYHHLFQELLIDQLTRRRGADYVAALWQRASIWCERQGLHEEALDYALKAGDMTRAATLVAGSVQSITASGQWYVLTNWLNRLPESVIWDRPLLLLARAYQHYYRLEVAALPPILDRISGLQRDHPEEENLAAEVAVFRAFFCLMAGDGEGAARFLEPVFADTRASNRPGRALAELLYALAGQMNGDGDRVQRQLHSWLSSDSKLIGPIREVNLMQALLLLAYIGANPTGVGPLLKRSARLARDSELNNLAPWTDYIDGLFSLQRGDFDSAIRSLEAAREKRYFHHIRGAVDTMCALAIAYQLSGQSEQASVTLDGVEVFIRERQPSMAAIGEACACRLAVLRGEKINRESCIALFPGEAIPALLFWYETPEITACRELAAAESCDALREADRRLADYAEVCEAQHNTVHAIEVLALRSLILYQLGRPDEALVAQQTALELAEPGGFILPWLELGKPMLPLLNRSRDGGGQLVGRILMALGASDSNQWERDRIASSGGSAPPIGRSPCACDRLTQRELDVLQLLSQRMRDKEIAERLHVSAHTVKFHLKHIYQKLDVTDRRGAVQRAQALGCLDPGICR